MVAVVEVVGKLRKQFCWWGKKIRRKKKKSERPPPYPGARGVCQAPLGKFSSPSYHLRSTLPSPSLETGKAHATTSFSLRTWPPLRGRRWDQYPQKLVLQPLLGFAGPRPTPALAEPREEVWLAPLRSHSHPQESVAHASCPECPVSSSRPPFSLPRGKSAECRALRY